MSPTFTGVGNIKSPFDDWCAQKATAFVKAYEHQMPRWEGLIRIVLDANQFIYCEVSNNCQHFTDKVSWSISITSVQCSV
jgi:hypothetical protein